MKTALQNRLRRLALIEVIAVCALIMGFIIARLVTGEQVGIYAMTAILTLCIFFLQNAGYWTVKRQGLSGTPYHFSMRIISCLYVINLILIAIFPLLLAIGLTNTAAAPDSNAGTDTIIGLGIYVFCLIAFIHLFLVKLVRSRDDARARTNRRQVSARFMRELVRAENAPRV